MALLAIARAAQFVFCVSVDVIVIGIGTGICQAQGAMKDLGTGIIMSLAEERQQWSSVAARHVL